jgi:hypothetical protein
MPSGFLEWLVIALGLYGAWALLEVLFRNVRFLYTQYFRSRKDLIARSSAFRNNNNKMPRTHSRCLQRYGADSWAVITGGSDGIGLGFAVELARCGFNVCLMSRSLTKLEAAKAEVSLSLAFSFNAYSQQPTAKQQPRSCR